MDLHADSLSFQGRTSASPFHHTSFNAAHHRLLAAMGCHHHQVLALRLVGSHDLGHCFGTHVDLWSFLGSNLHGLAYQPDPLVGDALSGLSARTFRGRGLNLGDWANFGSRCPPVAGGRSRWPADGGVTEGLGGHATPMHGPDEREVPPPPSDWLGQSLKSTSPPIRG